MSDPDSPDTGLAGSVRRVADSLLALAHNRASLLAVEFQAERLRMLDRIFWLTVGLSLGLIGLVIATVALALYLWQTNGFTGLVILAVVFLLAATVVLIRLKANIRNSPQPFSGTLAEFERDRSCLRDQS
jgi:uncharacterized membrane protein YqjE